MMYVEELGHTIPYWALTREYILSPHTSPGSPSLELTEFARIPQLF